METEKSAGVRRAGVVAAVLALFLAGCGSSAASPPVALGDSSPVFQPGPSGSNASTSSAAKSTPISASPVPSPSGGPSSRPAVSASGSTASRPAGSKPAYVFAPRVAAAGPTPGVVFSVADLISSPSHRYVVDVGVTAPGAVYLNAYASTLGFPINSIRGCFRQRSGPACIPVRLPNPAYWAVGGPDLKVTTEYELVIETTQATASLMGLHIGWDGGHSIDLKGLQLAGGCTSYKAGCGVRAHVTLGSGGPVVVTSATSGLHITIKDDTVLAKLASTTLRGSLSTPIPTGHEWSMHLFPANGSPVPSLSLSVRWP